MKIRDAQIAGQKVVLNVDRHGKFYASVFGENIEAGTIEALTSKLRSKMAVKKAKVAVRLTQCKAGTARDLTVTGLHAGNGRLMATYDDTKRPADLGRFYFAQELVMRLTPQEAKTYEQLHAARVKAERALDAFFYQRKIDPKKVVEKAIEQANEEKAIDEIAHGGHLAPKPSRVDRPKR
jgi:hypothetical protein